jgi:hypothetical protein
MHFWPALRMGANIEVGVPETAPQAADSGYDIVVEWVPSRLLQWCSGSRKNVIVDHTLLTIQGGT